MTDYYQKLTTLSEPDLMSEIKRIQDRLFKLSPEHPMFAQLQDMMAMATQQHQEMMYMSRNKDLKDEVLEIGEMESTDYTPDYTNQELLNITVDSYTENKAK